MREADENVLSAGLNPGGLRAPGHLNEVDAGVRLRLLFADLADEDVDSAKGDPEPILN